MDGQQFDRLTQGFTQALSRRRFGALFAALGLWAGLGAESPAKPKKKKKKKKPKPCANGTVRCGTACIDTQSNAQHCGDCEQSCGSGQACDGGQCQTGSCPGNQERCGGQCVNLSNDEAHCGACGRSCAGDLTCLSGDCACAQGTKCGTACVDLQTDDDHCGQCSRTCTDDLTCINGDCGCAAGTKCGTDCVNTGTDNRHCGGCGTVCGSGTRCEGGECVQPPECSSDFDCGAGTGDLTCRNGRCVCKTDGEGICYRYNAAAGVAGECNPCCTGGNGICLRDHVCRGDLGTTFGGVPYPICHCPAGTVTCNFGESFRCTAGTGTDPRRCGINCTDCTERGPTSFCCFGECMTACEPNTNCNLRTCGGCQTCTGDTACCRVGTSNLFGCALLVNGQCPGPPP